MADNPTVILHEIDRHIDGLIQLRARVADALDVEPGRASSPVPADTAHIDLRDGNWVCIAEAVHLSRSSETTVRRRIRRDGIGQMVGGRWYVDRRRLLGGR